MIVLKNISPDLSPILAKTTQPMPEGVMLPKCMEVVNWVPCF